jgi:hypothetical protein
MLILVNYLPQACSINSPDYGPLPPDAPSWCQAPFDPEGILRFIYISFFLVPFLEVMFYVMYQESM